MEALSKSSEVQAAKTIRKTAKCALTRLANILKKELILEAGKKYDFSEIDKYSIKTDAAKLEQNLELLSTNNETYAKVAREVLIKSGASEDSLVELDNTVYKYWIDSRKEATEVLNIYKFEYSTALERYLKTLMKKANQQSLIQRCQMQRSRKLKRRQREM